MYASSADAGETLRVSAASADEAYIVNFLIVIYFKFNMAGTNTFCLICHEIIPPVLNNVPSESLLHLLLWLIFRQMHPNFINVRTAYASKIRAHLTKNPLIKSSTKRFREYIISSVSTVHVINKQISQIILRLDFLFQESTCISPGHRAVCYWARSEQ